MANALIDADKQALKIALGSSFEYSSLKPIDGVPGDCQICNDFDEYQGIHTERLWSWRFK